MKLENNGWSADDVGPGWKHLVDPLIALANVSGARVNQIKEKFGTLRFYYDPGGGRNNVSLDAALYMAIQTAERWSAITCEDCGRCNGKPVPRGDGYYDTVDDVERRASDGGFWVKTLCKACREKNV